MIRQLCLVLLKDVKSRSHPVPSPTTARHHDVQVLTCQATTGQDIPSSLARVSVALATSPASLLSALQQLPSLAPGLVVVDCLTTPVMPLVTDNSLQAAFALGSRAAQLLLRAADGGAAGGGNTDS